jgi:hypothetical protein
VPYKSAGPAVALAALSVSERLITREEIEEVT